jgi:hypothetical protein
MRIFLLSLSILISSSLLAQKFKKFSEKPEEFIPELQSWLGEFKEKDEAEAEALFLSFQPIFSSEWDADQQQPFIQACNNLLRKRLTEWVSWYSLIKSATSLYEQEEVATLNAWLNHFAELSAKSPQRKSADYLYISMLNLTDSLVSDIRNVQWRAQDGLREFKMDPEPVFYYSDIDLWGFFRGDSTVIEGTSGRFDPQKQQFQLEGGTVFFTRAGFGYDTVNATISRLLINVDKGGYEADSVTLNSLIYLTEPTLGRLEEQMSSQRTAERATFPRFESYSKNIKIENIVEEVDFVGGFSMIGSKFYGSGSEAKPAKLYFKYEGKPLVKAASDRFRLQTDLITTEASRVSIYLKEDSIAHPKLGLRLIIPQKTLSLIRADEGSAQTAIVNSYHDMDMFIEVIRWKQGEPLMSLGNLNLGGTSAAVFESDQYFRGERFGAIQGLSETNPLYYLSSLSKSLDRKKVSRSEVQHALRMSEPATERFLLNMMVAGFVDYDVFSHTATIKDKTFEYIQNAEGKRDYDVIRFQSQVTKGENARLSLLDYQLEINGIDQIAVSDSQKVAMFPKGGKILMQEDFNFKFDGVIRAGRFTYWGNEYLFNYEQFKVNMTNIDSMKFKVMSFNTNSVGQRFLVNVKTTLQDINGELFIDKADNKSGRKTYHDFPIFVSGKESYVYYDRRDIFNRVYPREEFFVEVLPFTIDSLDNTTTEGLKFDGTFVSAGIFPDMEQSLKVQRDYSLGFKTKTTEGGLPAYGGKGQFTDSLSLSNQGLIGKGVINYLASTSTSEGFFFFPDSTKGTVDDYELIAQIGPPEHPHVLTEGSEMRWQPYQDLMKQTSGQAPFRMYDDIGMLTEGTLALSPYALRGKGRTDFLDAQMDSKTFLFKQSQFEAEEADFRVRVNPQSDWGFSMNGAKSFVDFETQQGKFEMLDPAQFFSFDINQYIAFMDRANWDIPAKTIEVRNKAEGSQSQMVSVNKAQDSLQYMAGSAEFSLLSTVLEVYEANEIDVADARIFPDSGRVTIDSAADMRVLEKSRLLADRYTQYHQLYDCSLKITSRKYYKGSGILEFIDKDEVPWPLYFHTLRVNRDIRSEGIATVEGEDEFYMSPFFAFKGKVELFAPSKNLIFDGQTIIQNTCDNIVTTWFPFRSAIDPNRIVIDLPKFGEDKAAERLFNGIFISSDSTSGYSAFLSRASKKADLEIIRADGVLLYDESQYSYVIARKERLDNPDERGNYLLLNNRDCFTEGQGQLSFGEETGMVEIQTYGVVTHNLDNDAIDADLYMAVQFPFDDGMLKMISEALIYNMGEGTTDISRRAFRIAVNELFSEKEKRKFDEEVELYGAPEDVPNEMRHTITFSDIQLKWDARTNSFLSEGAIGIGSILKTPINMKLKGTVQLKRKRRGDELYIYFKDGLGTQYYFGYKRNVMQFFSTNEELMTVLKELDAKKRRYEGENNKVFNVTQASKGKVSRFVNRE